MKSLIIIKKLDSMSRPNAPNLAFCFGNSRVVYNKIQVGETLCKH